MEIKGTVANKFKKKITGNVRIIYENEINLFKKNEILVTESTNPNFLPAMLKAKAIITESGGLLSHSAIVSRELNIPCIIGIKNATEIFKNGNKIILNPNGVIIYD